MALPNREVIVSWHDAYESSNQHTEADIPHCPLLVRTRGVLLREDERGVSIASEDMPNENPKGYRAVTFIPSPLIVSVEYVKTVRSRKPTKNAQNPSSSSNSSVPVPSPVVHSQS